MSNQTNLPDQSKTAEATKHRIAISKSDLQSGKITQQQYDDIVKRNFDKPDRFEENEPGNGD